MTDTLKAPPAPPPSAAAVNAENPWPGLESFHELDAGFFRGRAAETEALVRLVLRERLSVLYGLSGLGKSSLLRAGLFPLIREETYFPVYVRLAYDDGAPPFRQQVFDALAAEAGTRRIDAPAPVAGDTLWEYFHRREHACWSAVNRPVFPLLVFDQFEEVFTLGRDPRQGPATAAFLDELGDLIEGRPAAELKARLNAGEADPQAFVFNRHPYRVLLGIREDYLADLESLAGRVPSIMSNRMRLSPLRGDAALLVTRAGGPVLVPPPQEGGGPGVGERIVRLVAGESSDDAQRPLASLVVDPAFLSLFCRELNERRKAAGRESIEVGATEGGQDRDQILADYYARSTAALGPAAADARRFMEERLLTVAGHRNSEDLENALAERGITRGVVDALIARRLVRPDERDGTRLELTHDVLTGIVRQSRDRRRAEEEASAEAERLRLEAEARVEEERERAEQLEREAVLQRREAVAAKRATRIAWLSAGVCFVLAVLAVAAAVYAQGETRKARKAELRADTAVIVADSARRRAVYSRDTADAARDAAARARDSLRSKNDFLDLALTQLRDTTAAMRLAQQQQLVAQQRATLEQEVASQYLAITGQLNAHRVEQDTAYQLAFQQRLEALRKEAQQLHAQAVTETDQHDHQIRAIVDAICAQGTQAVRGDPKRPQPEARNTALLDSVRTLALRRSGADAELEKHLSCTPAGDQ